MKKLLLIVGVLTSIAATHFTAQQNEGVISYEVKINMHRNLPPDRQQMKEMLPEYRTSTDQLYFNQEESLYKPVEDEPDPHQEERGPQMRINRPKSEIYIHRGESRRVMLQEFMGKKYLIEDTLRTKPWKIGTETMDINGYSCRKAILRDEERKIDIVAWYAEQFRPFLGPENFNTLPGAVLLVDINNGERTITAKAIDFRPLEKNEIKVPAAKTRVTEEEYRKIVREQTERMRANGRNIRIRN